MKLSFLPVLLLLLVSCESDIKPRPPRTESLPERYIANNSAVLDSARKDSIVPHEPDQIDGSQSITAVVGNEDLGAGDENLLAINYRIETLKSEFDSIKYFDVPDSIFVDFDGDLITDTIFFSVDFFLRQLIFIKGGFNIRQVLTWNNGEGGVQSDFGWVDYWALTTDTVTYGTTNYTSIEKGDRITLVHPSLVLRVDEAAGALLTIADGNFRYVHQSD
ncbi:hypothetical protein CLV84_3981 [Neolewinella xylanilytica]|uniref:Uncharacterized protein n=1 Tax=Neolewinella xylanilytica TaxID=1514080 RepID=A0A2S6I0C9_9BACT|nr:hypothetical protein [Neolewinella xylanilytica]PPK84215.1 hypothetical protein CLV84_3981 [Neolewinella xylanilytica]